MDWNGPSVTMALRAKLERAELDPGEDPLAATAIALAEKLDAVRSPSTGQAAMATPGIARTLHETVGDLGLEEAAGPRLGRLRGEEAMFVAAALGYPNPSEVDVKRFDAIEALVLKRGRRLAGLPPQLGLDVVVDGSIEARRRRAA